MELAYVLAIKKIGAMQPALLHPFPALLMKHEEDCRRFQSRMPATGEIILLIAGQRTILLFLQTLVTSFRLPHGVDA